MIARSEDEFEKFQQMHIQRRREDAALGAERKPRLMEENEIPPFMLEEDDDIEEEVPEEILGRGNRSKKDTNYDDQMSEREWLKAIGVSNEQFGVDKKCYLVLLLSHIVDRILYIFPSFIGRRRR